MAINTTERTFEQEIEWWLIEGAVKNNRYKKGNPADFDRTLALDKGAVLAFVKGTQPDIWHGLCKRHGSEPVAEAEFFKRLNSELNARGMIDVLRHGLVDLGISVRLAFFKPGSGMNQSLAALYNKNVLQITRQVKYSLQNENSIDTVILLNGLPIITIELKNRSWSTYKKRHGNTRPIAIHGKCPCFQEAGYSAFCVDTEQVWETTCLRKLDTLSCHSTRAVKIAVRAIDCGQTATIVPYFGRKSCKRIVFWIFFTASFRFPKTTKEKRS